MKVLTLIKLLIVLYYACSTFAKKQSFDQRELFHRFIKEYKKNYVNGSSEYNYRFRIFVAALERIRNLNRQRKYSVSALYGITEYSDMTPKEFQLKLIFGRFKRTKYSIKTKYLPNNHNQTYSKYYFTNNEFPPLPSLNKYKGQTEKHETQYLKDQHTLSKQQQPLTIEEIKPIEMEENEVAFARQKLAQLPSNHFKYSKLNKQINLNVHDYVLNMNLINKLIDENLKIAEENSLKSIQSDKEKKIISWWKKFSFNDLFLPNSQDQKITTEENLIDEEEFGNSEQNRFKPFLNSHSKGNSVLESQQRGMRNRRNSESSFVNIYDEILPKNVPRKKDWRDEGVVSEVANQGACGACWAHSTIQTIESMAGIKQGKKQVSRLSVQQVVDCASNNYGCEGGDTCTALKWMASNNILLQSERVYPNQPMASNCKIKESDLLHGVRVMSNYTCTNFTNNEVELIKLLAFHGPVATAVDATAWQDYLGGIIQYHCETERNHAVQVVGYDISGEVPYYIVRNTWGKEFGIDGYLHVAIGGNLCAIEERVSAIDVSIH